MLTDQTFMVANRCNLSCTYCYYEVGTSDYLPNTLPPEVYGRWLAACAAAGHPARRVSITGGEPTLRPDLSELIGVAGRREVQVAVFTNAVAVSDEVVDALLSVDGEAHVSVDHVSPTLDDRVRGGTRATLAGIRALGEAGVRGQLCMVVTARNWHDVGPVCALGARFGWPTELLAVSVPPTHPLSLSTLSRDDSRALARTVWEHADVDGRPGYYSRLQAYLATGRVATASGCRTAREGVFVSSDGAIALCPQRGEPLGSIQHSSPEEVLAAKAEASAARRPGSCVSLDCLVLL